MNISQLIHHVESLFGAEAVGELVLLNGASFRSLHAPSFPPSLAALITLPEPADAHLLEQIRQVLRVNYPADFPVQFLAGRSDALSFHTVPLHSLAQAETAELKALYVPVLGEFSSMESFQEVIAHLRAPDGCPWDREQTHESLRPFILEETYELLDEINAGNAVGLKEELGDILLQIFLHAQVACEAGDFSLPDVVQAAGTKMVRRHPHVFSDVDVNGQVSAVLSNWQDIKEAERKENGEEKVKGMLDGVPNSMPSLLMAQEYQGRAAAVGFDWDEISGVLEKVEEEVAEIRAAASPKERAGEIGDLLFALVNMARWLGVDAESELRRTNEKFYRRFRFIETRAQQTGQKLTAMGLKAMDEFWNEAKSNGL